MIVAADIAQALTNAKYLGGGFYGQVFKIKLQNRIYACKIFKANGFAVKEAQVLKLMLNGGVKCPKTYGVFLLPNGKEALLEDYIDGRSCEKIPLSHKKRNRIGNQIIEQLLIMQSITNSQGYGFVADGQTFASWRAFYKDFCDKVYEQIKNNHYAEFALNATAYALNCFESVFSEEPLQGVLVHGDYNPFNIMIDAKGVEVKCVIDPISSMWADREYELFQLNCGGGKKLGLLKKYREKVPLSKKFKVKNNFYAFFAELNHLNTISDKAYEDGVDKTEFKYMIKVQQRLCSKYFKRLKKSLKQETAKGER